MSVARTTRRQQCTVAVELNRYGAMTLRSDSGRTYQVVGTTNAAVDDTLAQLAVDSRVTVRLAHAHGRGNSWYVTAIEEPGEDKLRPSGAQSR